MKKVVAGFTLLLCVLTLSGCGSKTLKCTKEQDTAGMKGSSVIDVTFKDDNISIIDMKESFTMDSSLSAYMNIMKEAVEQQFDGYKGKGVTIKVNTKDTKLLAEVKFDLSKMNSSSKKKINLVDTKAKYDGLKKELTTAGYTCK